ncbi:hypothetical protein M0802_015834 [Mischocyttarus mexicanus]|nr:hypothetical protein M0802_015834 [Mischocyttarus mexicanus]
MATGDVCGVGLEENDDDDETIRRPQLCEEGELIDCMPSPTDTLPPSTNSKRSTAKFCSGHTGRKTSWEEKQRVEFLWLQPVPG